MKNILIKIIKLYQKTPVSSHNYCKFLPTCSEYTIIALERHGLFKGCFLGIKRILRCNPLFKGGIDLVPEKKEKK